MAGLLDADVGPSTVAQAYRLLRAVMNTALDDELIRGRNPCRIKGADKEHAPERPAASVEQVHAIAQSIRPWYRALVLTAALTVLRWGELTALRRRPIDLDGARGADLPARPPAAGEGGRRDRLGQGR